MRPVVLPSFQPVQKRATRNAVQPPSFSSQSSARAVRTRPASSTAAVQPLSSSPPPPPPPKEATDTMSALSANPFSCAAVAQVNDGDGRTGPVAGAAAETRWKDAVCVSRAPEAAATAKDATLSEASVNDKSSATTSVTTAPTFSTATDSGTGADNESDRVDSGSDVNRNRNTNDFGEAQTDVNVGVSPTDACQDDDDQASLEEAFRNAVPHDDSPPRTSHHPPHPPLDDIPNRSLIDNVLSASSSTVVQSSSDNRTNDMVVGLLTATATALPTFSKRPAPSCVDRSTSVTDRTRSVGGPSKIPQATPGETPSALAAPSPMDPYDVFYLIQNKAWQETVDFVRSVPNAAKISKRSHSRQQQQYSDEEKKDCDLDSIHNGTLPPASDSSSRSSDNNNNNSGMDGEDGGSDNRHPHSNVALHEACMYQPPIQVIEVLLQFNHTAVELPGHDGCLPLHLACIHHSSRDIVTKLLRLYPAAIHTRDALRHSLPLHLAVQNGAEQDVLMDLLVQHPEASLSTDRTGQRPIDYAMQLPASNNSHRDVVITTLRTAPLLIATAKAAQQRLEAEYDTRVRGLQQAHQEFTRQLKSNHQKERAAVLRQQLQLQNDLTDEKDRNILLAEAFLKLKEDERSWQSQKSALQKAILDQQNVHHQKMQKQETEYQSIIDGAVKRVERLQETLHDQQHTKRQLEDLRSRYDEIEQELADEHAEVEKKQELIDRLQELLKSRDAKIQSLQRQIEHNESAQLTVSRIEMRKMREHSDHLQQQLLEANRKVAVQEHRLTSVKNQVAALTYNLQNWAMDDEWELQRQNSDTGSVRSKRSLASNSKNIDNENNPAEVSSRSLQQRQDASFEIEAQPVVEGIETVHQQKPSLVASSDQTLTTSASTDHDDSLQRNPSNGSMSRKQVVTPPRQPPQDADNDWTSTSITPTSHSTEVMPENSLVLKATDRNNSPTPNCGYSV